MGLRRVFATAFLEKDDDLLQELKRLSNSFGIGIIRFDITNLDDSESLFLQNKKKHWTGKLSISCVM
ncbi:hypothetical protein [Desulfitobacterium metallireducens]|uniref:hypothetical protein n=1 Tax=Desulfitobacterium metallireducens TaxID=142877 RepID=UPI0002FB91EF|nr:hypothetical protein [Desulfitobacterium metallireducens]